MTTLIGTGTSNRTPKSVHQLTIKHKEIVVIVSAHVSDNPFGHVAIALEGKGIYSYGTGTPPVGGKGTSIKTYLKIQTKRRSSTAFFIRVTDKQLDDMFSYLSKLPPTLPDALKHPDDTCASRTNEALLIGGFDDPRRDPISLIFFPKNSSIFPADSYVIGKSYAQEIINLPQGNPYDESRFSKFES
jgi:hypothetical protein